MATTVSPTSGLGVGTSPTSALGAGGAASDISALAGGLSGGDNNALGGYSNDINSLIQQLKQYFQQGANYLTPYSTAGTGALTNYQNALSQMSDPVGYYNKIMSTYNESPLAKFQRQQGLEDISSSAASKGLLGSTAMGRNLLNFSQGLTSKDMQDYFNNIMGENSMYLGGESNIAGMGLNASNSLANLFEQLGINTSELGQAAAQARAAQKASQGSDLGGLIGTAADIGGIIGGL